MLCEQVDTVDNLESFIFLIITLWLTFMLVEHFICHDHIACSSCLFLLETKSEGLQSCHH